MKHKCLCLFMVLFVAGCGESETINGKPASAWLSALDDKHPSVSDEAITMLGLSSDKELLEKARPRLRQLAEQGSYNAAFMLWERFREVDAKWVGSFAQFAASSKECRSALRDLYEADPTAVRIALMEQVEIAEKEEHGRWRKDKIEDFLIELIAQSPR